jgi:hypothetical protein
VFDVALTLALLAAFASIAFVKFALRQVEKVADDDATEGNGRERRSLDAFSYRRHRRGR